MRIVLTILVLVNVSCIYSQNLNHNDFKNKANILCKDGRRKIAYSELKGDSLFVLFENKIPIKNHKEELWLFSKDTSRIILFGKQIEFSVSSNKKYIAYIDNSNDLSTNSGVTSMLKFLIYPEIKLSKLQIFHILTKDFLLMVGHQKVICSGFQVKEQNVPEKCLFIISLVKH